MDDESRRKVSDFEELMKEYGDRVSSRAISSAEESKFNKPSCLPLTSDIIKLMNYISTKAASLKDDPENYDDYAKILLAWLIIYNRKRAGEVQK